MAFIILYVLKNSLDEILKELVKTNPFILVGVLIFGVLFLLIEGKNIAKMVHPFQDKFTEKDGFWCYCYAAFCRVVSFGTATTVSEVLFYRKKELKVSEAIGVTTVHMILYKIASLFYSIVGVIVLFSQLKVINFKMLLFVLFGIMVTALIIFTLFFLSINESFHRFLIKMANKWIKKTSWLNKIDQLNEQIYSLRLSVKEIMLDRRNLIYLLVLNFVKLIFWYSIPFITLSGAHGLSYLESFCLVAITVTLSGVIPTPAGIGSFEFVYLLLFKPVVGTVDAVSSLLLYRFATYMLPFLLGLVYTAKNKRIQINEEIQDLRDEQNKEVN